MVRLVRFLQGPDCSLAPPYEVPDYLLFVRLIARHAFHAVWIVPYSSQSLLGARHIGRPVDLLSVITC